MAIRRACLAGFKVSSVAGLAWLPQINGYNGIAKGERASASMVDRDLSDRTRLSTGDLLQMQGTAEQDVEPFWRFKNISNHRPTLLVETEEMLCGSRPVDNDCHNRGNSHV